VDQAGSFGIEHLLDHRTQRIVIEAARWMILLDGEALGGGVRHGA
jgi:hypothetical protein